MKNYAGDMKEYVEGSRTWKNSELYLLYRLWDLEERSEVRVVVYSFFPTYRPQDLEKFQVFPLYIGSGTWKNSKLYLSERGALDETARVKSAFRDIISSSCHWPGTQKNFVIDPDLRKWNFRGRKRGRELLDLSTSHFMMRCPVYSIWSLSEKSVQIDLKSEFLHDFQ